VTWGPECLGAPPNHISGIGAPKITDGNGAPSGAMFLGAGLLTPQIPGGDLGQSPVGDFVDVECVRSLGVVAHAERQDIEGQSPLLVAGDKVDDSPASVRPGDAGLDAFGQIRPVARLLIAGQQLVDRLAVSFSSARFFVAAVRPSSVVLRRSSLHAFSSKATGAWPAWSTPRRRVRQRVRTRPRTLPAWLVCVRVGPGSPWH
jgi:hypothetical protein